MCTVEEIPMKELKALTKSVTGVGERLLETTKESLEQKIDTFTGRIKGFRLLSSIETTAPSESVQFDDKHYFLVPYSLEDCGFIIHSLRALPDGIPPVNDLQKRRIFHLPTLEHQKLLLNLVTDQTEEIVRSSDQSRTGDSLFSIADAIDKYDNKITNGLILVGGIVAIANPVTGVAIAAHALIPGVGAFLTKAGLKWTGEKLNRVELEQKIEKAKTKVLSQFSEAKTFCISNPLLRELEVALSTTKEEHDPMKFNVHSATFQFGNTEENIALSAKAILDVYKDARTSKKLQKRLGVGPEDLQWFDHLEFVNNAYISAMKSPEMQKWRHCYKQLANSLEDRGDSDLASSLQKLNENINTLAPLMARIEINDNDQYALRRIFFALLPELVQRYLSFSILELDMERAGEPETPRTSFRTAFNTLYNEATKLVDNLYLDDAREIRLMSQYLRESYEESNIKI